MNTKRLHTKRLLTLKTEKIKRLRLLIMLNEAKKAAIVAKHIEKLKQLISKINPKIINLTPRENEVLDLIIKGFETNDIACKLFITKSTVKKHIGNILGKMDLKSRNQILTKYIKNKGN